MANTFAAELIMKASMGTAARVIMNKFAPLRYFARQWSVDPLSPKSTVVVKLAIAGSATLEDTDNFQQGDSVIEAVEVPVVQITQPWEIPTKDLNSGFAVQDLAETNADIFCAAVQKKINAVMTTANFPAVPVTSNPAAFGLDGVATLYGQLKKAGRKYLILDGDYFGYIASKPGFDSKRPFGWDGVADNTEWTGAEANVAGIAFNPNAIAIAGGLPAKSPFGGSTSIVGQSTILIEGMEFQAQHSIWYVNRTRSIWASLDIVFGAKKGDGTAAVLIKRPA